MMSAIVNQDWRPKTLRELFVMYQAVLLESWHHTAHLMGCFGGSKDTSYTSLHPYLASLKKTGIPVPVQSAIMSELEDNEDDFMSKMLAANYPPETVDMLPKN